MRRAFTLVELLVSIAVIGVLTSLTLVALSAAHRTSERMRCQSNVRQLALATLMHVSAHGHFPTGGWSGAWVGLPGRGFGATQPGGWAYNVLPYLEEAPLHSLGAKMSQAGMLAASAARLQTPVAVFMCPWRRDAQLYDVPPYAKQARGSLLVPQVAKCDYAMNSGDQFYPAFFGPLSLAEGTAASSFGRPRIASPV